MTAAWKIGILIGWLNRFYEGGVHAESEEEREKMQEMEGMIRHTQALIGDFVRLHLIMEAFGEVLHCDIPLTVRHEKGILEQSVEVYNWAKEGPEKALGCQLPPLLMNPPDIPANLKDRLIAAIERAPGTTFFGLIDALDRPLRCM